MYLELAKRAFEIAHDQLIEEGYSDEDIVAVIRMIQHGINNW